VPVFASSSTKGEQSSNEFVQSASLDREADFFEDIDTGFEQIFNHLHMIFATAAGVQKGRSEYSVKCFPSVFPMTHR